MKIDNYINTKIDKTNIFYQKILKEIDSFFNWESNIVSTDIDIPKVKLSLSKRRKIYFEIKAIVNFSYWMKLITHEQWNFLYDKLDDFYDYNTIFHNTIIIN